MASVGGKSAYPIPAPNIVGIPAIAPVASIYLFLFVMLNAISAPIVNPSPILCKIKLEICEGLKEVAPVEKSYPMIMPSPKPCDPTPNIDHAYIKRRGIVIVVAVAEVVESVLIVLVILEFLLLFTLFHLVVYIYSAIKISKTAEKAITLITSVTFLKVPVPIPAVSFVKS